MNKQEAIEELTNIANGTGWVAYKSARNIVEQIHEPQKVVVPKHIADKIEYCKNEEGYGLYHAMDYCYQYKDSADWLDSNEETLAHAWFYGYEVEKEKLYRVCIADNLVINDTLTQNKDSGIFSFSIGDDSESELFTKTKLEQSGFGWVFDCNGMKVEEVE